MRMNFLTALLFSLAFSCIVGCNAAPRTESDRRVLSAEVQALVVTLKEKDASIAKYFESAAGYAAFPSIGKGGLIIGGAFGRGEVFASGGTLVGYSDMTQASIGAQIGGQSFSEIIFFETKEALASFKTGTLAFSATASAVAVQSGAAAAAKYENGVVIFLTRPKGLMAELSIGGQQFNFRSLADIE